MKLLVQEKLSAKYFIDDFDSRGDYGSGDGKEFWKQVTDLLDKYSVHYKLEYVSDYCLFQIPAQKVTLDEFCMNDLFHNCLYLVDYDIEYAGLGGKGCDFSLELYAVKKL